MFKLTIYFQVFLIGLLAWSQRTSNSEKEIIAPAITLCHSGPSEMIAFLDDPTFVAFHPSPIPFDFNPSGEMVSFQAEDGKDAQGYLLLATETSDRWLFVYQEWWGLNDNIKEEAEKFHRDLGGKVNVLAIDMYDGNVTSNPQEAMTFMRGADENRLTTIVKAAQAFAGKGAEIANVGWCFGGAWSLKSALILGETNIGSIIYYGMPVRDVEQLKTLNSDVLGLFATEQNISKAIIEEFAAAMQEAGKKLNYKIFDAVHGFANPSNPRHDVGATEEAYGMALAYLKEKFGV
ncbi:dienelactone hydrolase family protein [Mongoliitalea daihaiensis]|uniref:dienelactone hydrolase family protein n=1 Tax=Mongoliitalea daihaiensis TaxID=2782006 RepID=UPI001F452EE0|nr:dienelactone hydrolase family protein [Mongoliitalea daihaiensis]UJP63419.1 dienelactone hydrolase family protein [Mongoliitalea daihaiensis]